MGLFFYRDILYSYHLKSAVSSASHFHKVRDALSRREWKIGSRHPLKSMRRKIGRTISRSIISAGDIIKPLGPPSDELTDDALVVLPTRHRIQNSSMGGRDEMARLPSESLLSTSFPSSYSSLPPSRLVPPRATTALSTSQRQFAIHLSEAWAYLPAKSSPKKDGEVVLPLPSIYLICTMFV